MRQTDEALGVFVASAWPRLVRTAYLLTGERAAAEDLVQAALVKVLGSSRRGGPPADLEAYTRTVLLRQALRWRGRKWNGESAFEVLPERGGADATASVDLALAVRAALRSLPAQQRAVLVLRYWEHRSEAEIAELLGVSVGTVKSRASRALAALRVQGLLSDDPEVRRG